MTLPPCPVGRMTRPATSHTSALTWSIPRPRFGEENGKCYPIGLAIRLGFPAGGSYANCSRARASPTRREHSCEFMISQASGVSPGQSAIRIGNSDRNRCGDLPRCVAIAVPTARSVVEASDKPHMGADVIIKKAAFWGIKRQNSHRRPAGGEKDTPVVSNG